MVPKMDSWGASTVLYSTCYGEVIYNGILSFYSLNNLICGNNVYFQNTILAHMVMEENLYGKKTLVISYRPTVIRNQLLG